MEKGNDKYSVAKRRAAEKIKLLKHFIIYIIGCVILALINNVTEPGGYQWWLWVFVLWGIGLLFHLIRTLNKGNLRYLEDKLLKKEMSKMGIKNGEVDVSQMSLPLELPRKKKY